MSISIPLRSRKYPGLHAVVDDEDYARVSQYTWWPSHNERNVYAMTQVKGRTLYMHRLITGYPMTDHIDHDGLNNRRANLRSVTQRENQANSRMKSTPKTSRFKGVHYDRARGKWVATIGVDGSTVYLGRFETEEGAAEAYSQAAIKIFGPFAHLDQREVA